MLFFVYFLPEDEIRLLDPKTSFYYCSLKTMTKSELLFQSKIFLLTEMSSFIEEILVSSIWIRLPTIPKIRVTKQIQL